MFEAMTFEAILEDLLSHVPDFYDKREGSVIYDALAPVAVELVNMYIALDGVLNETFADTASLEFLKRRAAERGITQELATNAVLHADFTPTALDIPIGSRFSHETLNYVVIEKIANGQYKVQCEDAGSMANNVLGQLIPIDFIDGLQTAELTELLIPAQDDEDVEHLRERYFDSIQTQQYGGNISDYVTKTESIAGVSGCKVIPVWDGGGTVKLIIIDSTFGVPSAELIAEVKNIMDPTEFTGQGYGLAPIGHQVTVVGVSGVTINIACEITYQSGWSWESAGTYITAAIDEYIHSLCVDWSDSDALIVRPSRIESAILGATGVVDVNNVTINGSNRNITLESNEIPVRGVIDDGN